MSTRSIILSVSLLLTLSTSISAAPGDLDPTFGNGGIVITTGFNGNNKGTSLYAAYAMAIQPDGKIVVVGEGFTGGDHWWDFAVVRYNPDGSLDDSFRGGIIHTEVGNYADIAFSVAIQTDGKILVAGSTCGSGCTGAGFAVVRYNPDGSLDTSFNGTGLVSTPVGNSGSHASDLAIQADGKIVVAGSSGNANFAIVRYNPNGSLDDSFNSSGKVITPVGYARSVAIQADGKIVVAGSNGNGILDSSFVIVRYNPNGSLDTSFNGTGNVITSVGNGSSGASDLVIQTDGKIVVAGDSLAAAGNWITADFAILRYNPDGSLDTSFGGTGKIIIPDSDSVDNARSVAIQPNGKIVVAGDSTNMGTVEGSDFALVRLNPNGSLDTSFNGTGTVTTSVGDAWDTACSVAIQTDGKIVVAGDTGPDDFKYFAVVRYQGDGATPSPTSTPTPTPTATPTPAATPTPTPGPSLHANGKIAFTSDRDGNREIYVMNPDGTNQVRLTNNQVVDDHPTWSPDGTKIAFVSETTSGGFAIFVMNADGTNRVVVTPLIFYNPTDYVFDTWGMSWSPDGNRIVFSEPSAAPAYPHDIFLVNIDGSNRQLLVGDPVDDRQPSWSPDGSRIIFSKWVPVDSYKLFTIRPDGTDLQALPALAHFDRERDFAPTWSPTGDKIAFQVWDYIDYVDIGIANTDGSNPFWFNNGSWIIDKPAWSPDGSKIVFQVRDAGTQIYVKNVDGTGLTRLTDQPGNNFKPSWQPLAPTACPNPIDCDDFFVRQHYRDFLNREPDADGLAFWTNEITLCGANQQCIEAKRINVSAAYFLSIEFQQTGYLVYRFYKAAYGNLPGAPVPVRLSEFLPEAQAIGQGVIVNQGNWQQQLETNKQNYANAFVQRLAFTSAYPTSMTPGTFVDTLFANAGVSPSSTDRNAAVAEFGSASSTTDVVARARALRRVADNETLVQQEFNRAFVLMQYFGYLRRNPNDAPEPGLNFDGYNFWLTKLNQFNGDFRTAEMVKAFLSSIEYRRRFGL